MSRSAGKGGSGEAGRSSASYFDTAKELGNGTSFSALLPRFPASPLPCNRCGFPVPDRTWGCKNPCFNCGTIYPLGDCSD